MAIYKKKFNVFTGTFDYVNDAGLVNFKAGVANSAALPLSGNAKNDARITNDDQVLYIWNLDAATGLISDWVSQGDILDIDWSAILLDTQKESV